MQDDHTSLANEFSRLNAEQRSVFMRTTNIPRLKQFVQRLKDNAARADALKSTMEQDSGAGLRSMSVRNLIAIVGLMGEIDGADALFWMGEEKRVEVLGRMDTGQHESAWQALIAREERLQNSWGNPGIHDAAIMVPNSLIRYRDSLYNCVVCHLSYDLGQDVLGADCGIHSCHKACELPDGACIFCQDWADIYPPGDEQWLKTNCSTNKGKIEVTGIGRHQPDKPTYIAVTFHPEKREMCWYAEGALERHVGRRELDVKKGRFVLKEMKHILKGRSNNRRHPERRTRR